MRLWSSLEAVSQFGATSDGGLHRPAASYDDGQARDLVVRLAREAGAHPRVDRVGNVFLRRPGVEPSLPAVAMGSHLDSQPTAGRYDGVYGVMAGLEVLRALAATDVSTRRGVELVIWTNEEGSRFPPAMMGSAVWAGRLAATTALATCDADGVSLAHALSEIGYAGTDVVAPGEWAAYLEAHIEQGPLLEAAGLPIGVVTGVQAQYWTDVEIVGERGHAGTFPMESRRDAVMSASRLALAVRRIGLARPGLGRATVGRWEVLPNSPNVIPGEVRLTVELRHPCQEEADAMLAELYDELDAIRRDDGVRIVARETLRSRPVTFAEEVVSAVAAAAAGCGLAAQRMVSGAGHDAVPVSDHVPTGMIFIPCVGGVSHAPAEAITPQWAADGARVLLATVLDLAAR